MAPIEPIEKRKARILKNRPVYADILEFYSRVFQLQEQSKKEIQLDPVSVAPPLLEIKRANEMPLIDPSEFVIDTDASARLLTAICRIAMEQINELSRMAECLIEAVDNGQINVETLFRAFLTNDDPQLSTLARVAGVTGQHLAMVTFLGVAPSIEIGAAQLAGCLEKGSCKKGYCPVCGNHPDLVFLDDQGKRHLKCCFCSHTWKVARLGCVFCENNDPDTRQYFFSPEEREYRVDLCDKCHRYIKGVDTRHLDLQFFPKLELVSTLHLDIKAREIGYTSMNGPG